MNINPSTLIKAKADFRIFLWLIWKHLGLSNPTPLQYDIAHYLQHGPKRKAILAYRGAGKSFTTSAFVLWSLWNNIELKVLVVSASKERADSFSVFTKRLLSEVPFLKPLHPDPKMGDRDSNLSFDVRGCAAAQAPSVKSTGITSQITGARADLIVADDVEVVNNSETAVQREKLLIRVAELGGAVLTPAGSVVFLGTPQNEDSLYTKLDEKGYSIRVWPSEVPHDIDVYKGNLAPIITELGFPPGAATDPDRFDILELAERKVEYGASGYALQFLLDVSPNSDLQHPLKTKDFIVLDLDVDVAPDTVAWSGGDRETVPFLPNVGLLGDSFRGPMFKSEEFSPYQDGVLYIDPSGRGRDQTGYCVLKMLNGRLFILEWGGLDGGYDNSVLVKLATFARDFKINNIVVEDTWGDGMFNELLKPVVHEICRFKRKDGDLQEGCRIEGVKVSGQKELRLIETLEPMLAGHRLVIDTALVKRITASKDKSRDPEAALKSAFYQMTRLTKTRGSLRYDDQIDALAGAVRWFTDRIGLNTAKEAEKRKQERLEEELLKFEEGILGPRPKRGWSQNLTNKSA